MRFDQPRKDEYAVMMRTLQSVMILILAVVISGCGEASASSQGKVAVIDLRRVAKATGWDARMTAELNAAQQAWKQRLEEEGTKIDQAIRAKREEIGEEPTPEQIAEFNRMRQEGQAAFDEAQTQASSVIQNKVTQLQGQFREEVRPYARQAADALGFKIVMIQSDALLSYDTGSDITDAVIAALLDAGKKYSATSGATPGAPAESDAAAGPDVPVMPQDQSPATAPQETAPTP